MSIKTIRPGFTLFSLLSLLSLRIRHALHATLVVCSLMAALPGSVQAQTTLSDRDYIEIQQLVNKLNFALDYCTNGGQDFADLFVEAFAVLGTKRVSLKIRVREQRWRFDRIAQTFEHTA